MKLEDLIGREFTSMIEETRKPLSEEHKQYIRERMQHVNLFLEFLNNMQQMMVDARPEDSYEDLIKKLRTSLDNYTPEDCAGLLNVGMMLQAMIPQVQGLVQSHMIGKMLRIPRDRMNPDFQ